MKPDVVVLVDNANKGDDILLRPSICFSGFIMNLAYGTDDCWP